LLNSNRFSVLEVTEPEVDEDAQESSEPPTLPPAEPRKPCWPKWEKRIKRKLVIRSLEMDTKCIMIPTHLKTTDTMEETSMEAMVDTGAVRATAVRRDSERNAEWDAVLAGDPK